MSTRRFTSDPHTGRANIHTHEGDTRRDDHGSKCTSIDQMDVHLLTQWHAVVDVSEMRPVSQAQNVKPLQEKTR